jgi:hypothetical protein
MIIHNETSINTELIKAIALDAGIDLRDNNIVLYIQYSSDLKGTMKDDNLGTCQNTIVSGKQVSLISILPWASTRTLAHEIRHAAQAYELGADVLNEIYSMEDDYNSNVFEIDAKEFEGRW